jgi:hypothetical protein
VGCAISGDHIWVSLRLLDHSKLISRFSRGFVFLYFAESLITTASFFRLLEQHAVWLEHLFELKQF